MMGALATPLAALTRVIGSTFMVSSLGRTTVQILTAATVLIAARYVDLAEFGVFALASAVNVILVTLVYTGFYHHILRTKDLKRGRDTLFWLMAALGALGSLLMVAVGLIATPATDTGLLFLTLSPIPLAAAPAAYFEALIMREGRVRSAVMATTVAEICGFVALVIAFEAGAGIMAFAASRLVATALVLVIKAAQAQSLPGFGFSIPQMSVAVRESLPLYNTTGTELLSNYGADLILGFFLNPLAVGTYRAGARVAVTGSDIVVQPLRAISWSRFARHERDGDLAMIRSTWLSQLRFLSVVAWPALIALSVLAVPVVEILLAESWMAAAPVLAILALANAVAALDVSSAPIFMCHGRGGLLTRLRLASALLLLLAILMAASFGPLAVAWAFLFVKLVVVPVNLVFVARMVEVTFEAIGRALMPGVLVSLICVAAILVGERIMAGELGGEGAVAFLTAAGAGLTVWALALAGLLSRRIVQLPAP